MQNGKELNNKQNYRSKIKNTFFLYKNKIKKIIRSDLTAKQIAINFTIGILIGLIIPMGLQTIAVIFFCTLFKLNFVIVVLATLISNPFTIVLIYFSAFQLGELIIQSGISWERLSTVLNNPSFDSILSLSFNSLFVLYTGLIIESLVFCSFAYFMVFYVVDYVKTKRNIKSA